MLSTIFLSSFDTRSQILFIRKAPAVNTLEEHHFPRFYPHRLGDGVIWVIIWPFPLHIPEPFLVFGPALNELECARVGRVMKDIEENAFRLINDALPTWSKGLEEGIDVLWSDFDGDVKSQIDRFDDGRHGGCLFDDGLETFLKI